MVCRFFWGGGLQFVGLIGVSSVPGVKYRTFGWEHVEDVEDEEGAPEDEEKEEDCEEEVFLPEVVPRFEGVGFWL